MMGLDEIIEKLEGNARSILAFGKSLDLLTEAMTAQTALLESIHRACTADIPESPYAEPIRELMAVVQEQTGTLRDIRDAIDAQPEVLSIAVREELDAKEMGE
jgi:hypothetical protein